MECVLLPVWLCCGLIESIVVSSLWLVRLVAGRLHEGSCLAFFVDAWSSGCESPSMLFSIVDCSVKDSGDCVSAI
jgi:hypothetical protein